MRLTALLVLALSTSALAAPAPEKAKAPAPAAPEKAKAPAPAPKNAAFERLKSLAGTWTGKMDGKEGQKDKEGQKKVDEVTITYKVIAAGSAVQETMFPGTPHEMVTMYTLEGDQLVLTHYCAAGNQPRMKLEDSKDPNVLSFRFTGGGNMKESDMHMHSARITFVDADHIKAVWSSMKDGKAAGEVGGELTRKK